MSIVRRAALAVLVVAVVVVSGGAIALARVATGTITTVAGTGEIGSAGDGGPATAAKLAFPIDVAVLRSGGYLVADQGNQLVRRVDAAGRISVIAGDGQAGYAGDGGPAVAARLNAPTGVAEAADGSVLIADANNNAIRRVAPDGTITTVAGTGAAGSVGDGGPATSARLSFPSDVVVTPDGGFLFADTDNHRIRRVLGGTITTVAGTGSPGYDGAGPATARSLNKPSAVAVAPDGGVLIADMGNHMIRLVRDGQMSTVAGSGATGTGGDGGDALQAQLTAPDGVVSGPSSSFYLSDRGAHVVRQVTADGRISRVAGTGTQGFGGDGGPAPDSRLDTPQGIARTTSGDLLVADLLNHRIRRVDLGDDDVPPPVTTPTTTTEPPPATTPSTTTEPPPATTPATTPAATTGPVPPQATSSTTTPVPTTTPDGPGPTGTGSVPAPGGPVLPGAPPAVAPPVADVRELTGVPGVAPTTTLLDGRGSQNASGFSWDVTGDSRPDLKCPSDQGILGLNTVQGGSAKAQLFALGLGDGVDPSQTIGFEADGYLPSIFLQTAPDVAACAADPSWFAEVPLPTCEEATVTWVLLAAQGCFFHHTDAKDVPAAEKAVAARHYLYGSSTATVELVCKLATNGSGRQTQAQCDAARARAIARNLKLDFYVSRGTVSLNGVRITPAAGASVLVFPALQRVVSSNATLRWGPARFSPVPGPIDMDLTAINGPVQLGRPKPGVTLDVGGLVTARTAPLLDFEAARYLPDIGGFTVDGRVSLALEGLRGERYSTATMELRAPKELAVFGGRPPSGKVQVRATTTSEPRFEDLDLRIPEARFGPVTLSDLRFRYALNGGIAYDGALRQRCSRKEWEAQADVYIAGGRPNPDGSLGSAGFKLSPPPSENGVGFCAGEFSHAGGSVTFGGPIPKPQLFPGVFLDRIGFGIRLNPFLVRGDGQLSVGELARVQGALVVAEASPWRPFVLSRADAGAPLAALAGRRFYGTTVMAGGSVAMKMPVFGDVALGNAALFYSFPDYFGAQGSVNIPAPGMRVTGGASFDANLRTGRFNAGVGGEACIAGLRDGVCFGATGNISTRGMVACLEFGPLHPGAGYYWGDAWPKIWLLDGCTPSDYWDDRVQGAPRAAGAPSVVRFTVARGETVKNVRLEGVGGAPAVRLTAPDGEVLDVAGNDIVQRGRLAGVRQLDAGALYLGVRDGRPGTYTVTALPGSAAFGKLSATRPGYDTRFTAKVTGRGDRRVLAYDARKRGKQQVTFSERGPGVLQRLAVSRGGRGTRRFTPAPGPAGVRTIISEATLDGVPIATRTIARYRYAGTPRTGSPGRVRVVRRKGRLLVSWSAAAGAARYGVVVEQGEDERRFVLPAGRRRLTVRGVPLADGGRVRVSAQGAMQDWGTPRSAPFRALRAAPTVLQTDRSNERRRAAAARRRGR